MNPKNTNETMQGKFSIEVRDNLLSETQVQHPILKRIINDVVAENAVNSNLGSSFGEAAPA